jgi:membrane protease YdiL (CAAX protease family)
VAFGLLAMLLYRRSGAIWPLMVIHYLDDLARFA